MGAHLVKPEANVRLRQAMKAAGLTYSNIACELRVSVKTAQRWVYEGRTPREERAEELVALLETERFWLWPEDDRCCIYSPAAAMPPGLLRHVTMSAARELWVMTGSAWLFSRVALRPGARLLQPPRSGDLDQPQGVEVRVSRCVETSVVRADEAMFVVISSFGWDVPSCPALFLTRTANESFFDRYQQGFERLWRASA